MHADWMPKIWSEPWSMFQLCECSSQGSGETVHMFTLTMCICETHISETCSKHACTAISCWLKSEPWSMFQLRECSSQGTDETVHIWNTHWWDLFQTCMHNYLWGTGGLNFGLSLNQWSYFMSASSQDSGETTHMLNIFVRSCSKHACTTISGGLED